MKIIAGVHPEFSGRFVLDGQETRFRSVRDARAAGIAMVHQELSVAPDLTVAENVFLGAQPTNRFGLVQWRRMAREAGEQLARFGIDVDPLSRLGDLPIGLQQLIEIARVLFSGARIIILDEPTSALSPPEVERLFATLRRLRDEGTAIVFISHFIEDILRVSDTVTVFRNGRKVAEAAAAADHQGGPDRGHDRQGPRGAGRDLHRRDRIAGIERPAGWCWRSTAHRSAAACSDVSFEVRAGEVLGVYGFMGCGQLELARILFGKLRPDAGDARRWPASQRPSAARPMPGGAGDRLRSGEPPRHAVPSGTGLQEHLDQHPRSYLLAVAEAVARTRDRDPAGRAIADQAAGRRDSTSACSPAAISRRSRWRNG